MLQVGIVGLPNVGKSSLFNALTAQSVPTENYPFCTVDPNVGIVEVPDPRLARIQELCGSREQVPTFIRFVDIAGLVRGAAGGEGLGNQFLGHVREVDAIAHVVRCFSDPRVPHVMAGVDPLRDVEVVETELALADLDTVERRWEKVEKKARSGEKDAILELEALSPLKEALSRGRPVRELHLNPRESASAGSLGLLTAKPVLYVANTGEEESDAGSPPLEALHHRLVHEDTREALASLSAALEADLAILDPEERREFLEEMGLPEGGLSRVIRAAYGLLDLITFFTTNEKQTRAWTIRRGTRAPEAAGQVHSDFQKGFIRAEAIHFSDLVAMGGLKAARDHGLIRSEGKDYEVQDGDILLFRYSP